MGGYVAAALTGPMILKLVMAINEVLRGNFRVDFFWAVITVAPLMASFVAILAAPLAIPSIALSERRKRCSWLPALAVGASSGLLISYLVNSIPSICERYDCALPSFWDRLITYAQLGSLGAASGLVFWLIAWVWFPPKGAEQHTEGDSH